MDVLLLDEAVDATCGVQAGDDGVLGPQVGPLEVEGGEARVVPAEAAPPAQPVEELLLGDPLDLVSDGGRVCREAGEDGVPQLQGLCGLGSAGAYRAITSR